MYDSTGGGGGGGGGEKREEGGGEEGEEGKEGKEEVFEWKRKGRGGIVVGCGIDPGSGRPYWTIEGEVVFECEKKVNFGRLLVFYLFIYLFHFSFFYFDFSMEWEGLVPAICGDSSAIIRTNFGDGMCASLLDVLHSNIT